MKVRKAFVRSCIAICACFGIICLAGCNASDKKAKKELKVITEAAYKEHVEAAAKYTMQMNPKIKVTIEYISTGEEDRDEQIQKLRTKIMAGGGADIYLLNSIIINNAETVMPLLENPDKTMQSGALASLDRYMKKDTYWEKGTYKKEFLEAGQYKGKQYIIPLSCFYEVLVSEDDDIEYLSDMNLEQWYEESKTSDHIQLKQLMEGRNLCAESWIKDAVDYENKKVNFDKEKWESFYMQCIPKKEGRASVSGQMGILMTGANNVKAIEVVPDIEGKKKASVSAFGAIGMSSDYKEEAYRFLMLFLNDEMKKEAKKQDMETIMDRHFGMETNSMPVREDTFQTCCSFKGWNEETTQLMLEGFRELEGAYFQTETERFLSQSVYEQSNRADDPRIDNSVWKENARKLSEMAWNRYQMQVQE